MMLPSLFKCQHVKTTLVSEVSGHVYHVILEDQRFIDFATCREGVL
jgi:hypothetical protein